MKNFREHCRFRRAKTARSADSKMKKGNSSMRFKLGNRSWSRHAHTLFSWTKRQVANWPRRMKKTRGWSAKSTR